MPCFSSSTSLAFKIASWVLNSKTPCSRQNQGLLLQSCPLASLLWQKSKDSSRSLVWQQKAKYKQKSAEIIRTLFFWIGLNIDIVKVGKLKTSPPSLLQWWRSYKVLHSPWHVFYRLYNNTYNSVQAWKEKGNGKGKLEGDMSKNSAKITNLLWNYSQP